MSSDPRQPVLIERTAKRWKAMRVVALILVCAGIGMCAATNGSGTAAVLLLLGLVVGAYAEIGAWWNHG